MLQAFLLGLCGAYGHIDWGIGTPYLNRPIILGPLVGLILGDLTTGIIIGGTLEVFFLGQMAIGSYIPPDAAVGGVLGTAFAINAGLGAERALTMAIPIAIIATSFQNVLWSIFSMTSKIADKYAAKGNEKGIAAIMFMEGSLNVLLKFCLVFFPWLFGADKVTELLNSIPQVFIDGMTVAGSLMAAIGLAMLMRMIMSKKVAPYYFLGFLLAAYLGVPVLGVAALGLILVLTKFDFNLSTLKTSAAETGEVAQNDDDF